MAQLEYKLSTDSLADELQIISFAGRESISDLFSLEVNFKVEKEKLSSINLETITTEAVSITALKVPTLNGENYVLKGMFSHVEEVFEHSNTHQYFKAIMVPLFWKQTQTNNYDIFPNMTAKDILLNELSEQSYRASLNQTYPEKQFICQYNESNFNFISRLASHWGAYFYFDHHNECSELILADDCNYPELPIPEVPLAPTGAPSLAFTSIRSLRREYKTVPEGVVVSETNPDQASQPYQGVAGTDEGKNVVHLVSEGADDGDEASIIAQIRLEELQQFKITYHGTTGIPCLAPGYVLKVKTPDESIHAILITEVNHSANNLDFKARSGDAGSAPYYSCSFIGIPKEIQYRPARSITKPTAVSTTARVYSAEDDQKLAHRNEQGKYKVVFDFVKGEEKVSNWIRRASHTAKTNHFDMPLTPGTEVQIGFVAGNPDRPYILNASENSESVFPIKSNSSDENGAIAVNSNNPHHAAIITDGMLYTGALQSRQELHISSDLKATDVNDHIANTPIKKLKKDGLHSGENVNSIIGDVHISRTYGERYNWREGVDFNYGLNATFNFGQQYIENHAYQDKADGEQFPIDENEMLDAFDKEIAGIVRSKLQKGLEKEREAGLVQKDFGNKYFFHEGYAYNWSAGLNGNGIHKTFNFGSAYVENHCKNNKSSGLVNNPTSGFPTAPDTNADLIEKTFGNTFDYQEGNQVDVLKGDITSEMTGDTDEKITGNITSELTGDTKETITGNIDTTLMGDTTENTQGNLTATIMGDHTVTHQGNQTITTVGDILENHTGSKTTFDNGETHFASGAWMSTYAAAYADTVIGLYSDTFVGGKFTQSKAFEFVNGKLKKDDATIVINNYKSTVITKTNISITKFTLNMLG